MSEPDEAGELPAVDDLSSRIIDGTALAAEIRYETKAAVEQLGAALEPKLAIISFQDGSPPNPYLAMRIKACESVGIAVAIVEVAPTTSQDDLSLLLDGLNHDHSIHGISFQPPLPSHLHLPTAVEAIDPLKDVEGLHPMNIAALATEEIPAAIEGRRNVPPLSPARPPPDPSSPPFLTYNSTWTFASFHVASPALAVLEVLDRSGVDLSGASVVVVVEKGAILGTALAMLMVQRDATVTIVHGKTRNPAELSNTLGDVLVVAVGRAEVVGRDWIKEGAVVVDLGMNIVGKEGGKVDGSSSSSSGSSSSSSSSSPRVVGDVDSSAALPICSLLTPVPGGMGPVSLAVLLRSIVQGAVRLARLGRTSPTKELESAAAAGAVVVRPDDDGEDGGDDETRVAGEDGGALNVDTKEGGATERQKPQKQ